MHLRRQQSSRPAPDNLLPLVGVVFMVLIFFLLAGRLASREPFTLQLPSSAANAPANARSGVVYVAADGSLALGATPVSLDKLAAALARGPRSQVVSIRADADAQASAVVDVFDALRAARIERVRLVTQLRSASK